MRLALLLALAPTTIYAEGARQTLDCRATLACDAGGACAPSDEGVRFTLDPVAVGAHGEGEYALAYGGLRATATLTTLFPLVTWSDADDALHYLIPAGEEPGGASALVWHTVTLPSGPATVRFLSCEAPP